MLKKYSIQGLMLLLIGIMVFSPELAFAQSASFDTKVNSITNMIVGKILPAVAVFGLVYAAILAATGDESSKRRMVLVIVASIVGILAKFIIPMFQSAV
ncbi:MAG: TrbC/VirB2 family protein [Bacteriovoracaceae bacterium]|jgi:type IV secretory pathway VirB2 component (pilin)